jgi:DNA-binding transcriptional regulator YbjK
MGDCKSCGGSGTTSHERKNKGERKNDIIQAAIEVALSKSYITMERPEIAKVAGCSPGLITPHYFATMSDLQDAVMSEAVSQSIPALILQGLAAKDPIAQGAPAVLKAEALELA